MNNRIVVADISELVHPLEMPVCPICDEEIRLGFWDVCIGECDENLCLVHAHCVGRTAPGAGLTS